MFSFLKAHKVSKNSQERSDFEASTHKKTLREGMALTRNHLGQKLSQIFSRNKNIDEDLFEELETMLLVSDVGVEATEKLLRNTKATIKREHLDSPGQVKAALREEMIRLLEPLSAPHQAKSGKPYVILVAGVNGVGKTTTIGKLTRLYSELGKKVVLAAGDTFRAAAKEQIMVWGERNNVTVISQDGADSAAVVFDAIESAKSKQADIVIADTAGRLPTQKHLMAELEKVKRVMGKSIDTAPNEVILVLDANTGQNAVTQLKAFDKALQIDSIILTKLDGTAKGGCLFGIAQHKGISVSYIGVGEGIDDLQPFSATDFVATLFE